MTDTNEYFTGEQIEKYADVLIWALRKSRKRLFKKGDTVLLRYDIAAMPLAEAVFRRLMREKLNPVPRSLMSPVMEKDFFMLSSPAQRRFIPEGEKNFFAGLAGNIFLSAPASLTHLKSVDPKRIGEVAVVRKKLRSVLDRKEAEGLFGWTLCSWTTSALAENAGISLSAYTAQIVKACFLDHADPVKQWEDIYRNVGEIRKWLSAIPARTFRVQSASVDLEISLGDRRRFIGLSGHNIPSFELFTSPDWRGTRGTYRADQPSFRNGNLVRGVSLEFRQGRAVTVRADEGEDFARKTIATDATACQVGEFSLTDRRFSRIDTFMADTLFDENYGGENGNCHIALGSSYADTYAGDPAELTKARKKALGFNDSALHWDLVNTEKKTVTAVLRNGRSRTIYDNGMFVM